MKEPLRYAHPFFGAAPPAEAANPFGETALSAWVVQQLQPIDKPNTPDAIYDVSKLIGQQAVADIQAAGVITFHAVGDTGSQNAPDPNQDEVAQMMTGGYTVGQDATNPAFLFHLGDVIYGPNKDVAYLDEFYRPYTKYPGKIVAISGNHDREVLPGTDPVSVKAFKDNFCAASQEPSSLAAGAGIARLTVDQPGIYCLIRAPFVDIVCLDSNALESPGSIVGKGGDDTQKAWLQTTLQTIAAERANGSARKALVFATHHPPYSSGGHGGSPAMLADIDSCCPAGLRPDAHLSGHSHNYQHYTRTIDGSKIPYIVAGCGGHNAIELDPVVALPPGDVTYDVAYPVKGQSQIGYGYLRLTASATSLKIEFFAAEDAATPFDSAEVPI
jgi:hypothetical protein